MNTSRLLDELKTAILLADGATGTELLSRGPRPETCVEHLNLKAPEKVLSLHRDYIAAGSRIIETNTFAANRLILDRYGLADRQADIIAAGVRLAKSAAAKDTYVAGSIGPLPFSDGEPLSPDDQFAMFTEQVELMASGGVDVFLFETFIDLEQLVAAVRAARQVADIPVIAQMAFEVGSMTASGEWTDEFVKRCVDAGADIVGANCGAGARTVLNAVRAMNTDVPVSAFMNAGFAETVEHRQVYMAPQDYLARTAEELVEAGARIVGGCCGTTPDTIRAIADRLDLGKPVTVTVTGISVTEPPSKRGEAVIEVPGIEVLKGIVVELDPPKGLNVAKLLAAAERLSAAGAYAVTLADNPMASVRVDTQAIAGMLTARDIRVIPHITGRDRNRIALQSVIMGSHVMGVRSILCVTGDPVRMYHESNTSGVFDVTSIGLVKLVSEFNDGKRLPGDARTSFAIGVAFNPNVRSIDGQINKLRRKIDAGAHFALTQPIFDVDRFRMMRDALEKASIDIPIFVGIMPLVSKRQMDFLHNEVPGIYIPPAVHERMNRFDTPEDQLQAGIAVASDLAAAVAPDTLGIYLISSRNRTDVLLPVMDAARSLIHK